MSSITSPAGTFAYTYNHGLAGTASSSSLIQKVALPNGAFITNTYDNNARMLGTWLYDSLQTNMDSAVYTYNAGNQRTKVVREGYSSGQASQNPAIRLGENNARYTYDAIGQVISDLAYERGATNSARLNEQLHYGFDPAGNLVHRTNNALVQNFQVNALNELTANTNRGTLTVMGATSSDATVTVNGSSAAAYNDNTFAAANMPFATNYTAVAENSSGQWATNTVTVNIATNATFQYDGNGNLTNDGLRRFAYDDENQLTQVWVSNQWLSRFAYDGKMRRRIRQEYTWQSGAWVQTNVVHYVYDGNVVIQERDLNNWPAATYTRGKDLSGSLQGAGGIGGLLSMTLNGATGTLISNSMYYHGDGNGNVTALIAPSQTIVAKYVYDAFGNVISKSGQLADVNPYRFSSKETHSASGLVYYLYRYYDPNLQRWPNRDPLGDAAFVRPKSVHASREITERNLYGFVLNNPLRYWDYLGLDNPGCDSPGDAFPNSCPNNPKQHDCYLRCCAQHDQCYYQNNCKASSWGTTILLNWLDGLITTPCQNCNNAAAQCLLLKCSQGPLGDPPNGPKWFCPNGPSAGTTYNDYSQIPASCWENGQKPPQPQ
jgi:RHS repeat-associated protein